MKKILISCLTLLLLCAAIEAHALSAAVQAVVSAGGAAETSCTGATNQLESFTASGIVNLGGSSANLWRASEIVYAGTTGTLCKLVANVKCTTEDCTQVITGKLYSDNGSDEVNTLVGSCTGTYDSAALSTSDTDIDLTSCSGTITNGTKYWLVLTANSADGTNYIKLSTDSTCTTEKVGYSADGSTWTYATGTCGVFKIYILE